MGDAGQDQEQPQLTHRRLTQSGAQAEPVSDGLQDVEQAKDGTEPGRGRLGMIEIAAQGTAQGFDAGWGPMGEIGEGPILDLAAFSEGLAEEHGGGRVAVGDGGNVHADQIH